MNNAPDGLPSGAFAVPADITSHVRPMIDRRETVSGSSLVGLLCSCAEGGIALCGRVAKVTMEV